MKATGDIYCFSLDALARHPDDWDVDIHMYVSDYGDKPPKVGSTLDNRVITGIEQDCLGEDAATYLCSVGAREYGIVFKRGDE